MSFLRMGSRMLSRTSPLGLITGGVVVAMAVPAVRKGLRRVAVVGLSGVLSLTDEARQLSASSRQKIKDLISEAKNTDHKLNCSKLTSRLKEKPRRMAVAAAAGVLAASDKARGLAQDASHELKDIVADAKNLRSQNASSANHSKDTGDGLEDNFIDLPQQ